MTLTYILQVGDLIRFFHKEMEAYLVAEGLFDDELTEDGMWNTYCLLKLWEMGVLPLDSASYTGTWNLLHRVIEQDNFFH